MRQCSRGRFFLLFRSRAFGKARAQWCSKPCRFDIPPSIARAFSANLLLPVTCESRRIGGQMIHVRFGMWIELTRAYSFGFLHIDADAHRCSLLQPHSNPFPNPLQSQPHYRSPSKVAPEHQRAESPSRPPPPTKLWQLVLLRLLCGSPGAACLPRSPWRGRFSFRWPYETRFRRTFYPPRSRLTRPRVGFCTWSLPTVAVWSQDGSVAVGVDCILEIQHMLDCHHLGYIILIHKTA